MYFSMYSGVAILFVYILVLVLFETKEKHDWVILHVHFIILIRSSLNIYLPLN